VLTYLIVLALLGLVTGALARLALPGRDPMGLWATMGVGLAGSFVGGLVVYALGGRNGTPFLVGFVFSVAIVYLVRRRRGGGLASPGSPERVARRPRRR